MTEPETERKRRRRRRASAPQGPVPGPPPTAAEPAQQSPRRADPTATHGSSKRRRAGKERNSGGTERGMRDLVGPGHSALGVDGALRGRDVNRPSEAELAEAERDVPIVRRNWRPPPEKG
jgi:hypothetical protein